MAWDGSYGENEPGAASGGYDPDTGAAVQQKKKPAAAAAATASESAALDARRKELEDKKARGEPLTPEEEAYLSPNNVGRPTQAIAPNGGWNGPVTNTGPNSLTDLRDRFLAERASTSAYRPNQVAGDPASRVALDRADFQQARGMSLDHIRNLQDVAAGRVPSIADAQRRAAMLDATQSAYGLAAASAPSQGSGGLRSALRATQEGARRAGLDAAMIQAKEISDARSQIGGQLEGLRTGDQNVAIAEAKRLQDLGISDADRALRAATTNSQTGLDAYKTYVDERAGLGKLGLEAEQTSSTTRLNEAKIEDMRNQLEFAYAQLAQAKSEAERNRWFGVVGSILGALGGVGAAAAGAPA